MRATRRAEPSGSKPIRSDPVWADCEAGEQIWQQNRAKNKYALRARAPRVTHRRKKNGVFILIFAAAFFLLGWASDLLEVRRKMQEDSRITRSERFESATRISPSEASFGAHERAIKRTAPRWRHLR